MSDEVPQQARDFLNAVENLCGEANEAARLANSLFEGAQLNEVRRALARCMELVDDVALPPLHSKYPQLRQQR